MITRNLRCATFSASTLLFLCALAGPASAQRTGGNPLRASAPQRQAAPQRAVTEQSIAAHRIQTEIVRRDEQVRPAVAEEFEEIILEPAIEARVQESIARRPRRIRSSQHVARHDMMAGPVQEQRLQPDEVKLMPGEMIIEDDGWAGDCCGGGPGGCLIPCPFIRWENLQIGGGVQGFTGPVNRGQTGSFGFNYSVNYTLPVPCLPCGGLTAQLGFRGVHSNFEGASFTPQQRDQHFFTAGVFRRVDWGLQFGLAYDYMRERWYYEGNLSQLRGEISWVYPECHELGFWFASSLDQDAVVSVVNNANVNETYEATDLYAFFYRRHFGGDAEWRFFAGFTGDSDGLIGSDLTLPLSDRWALEANFSYLIPEETNGFAQESWNVGIGLVLYPGCKPLCGRYDDPLFDVAHNGNFMVDRR